MYVIKGINLILKIFEFVNLNPDKNTWELDLLKDNPSSLIRLKQIDSLIQAFNLRSDNLSLREEIQQILNGDFFTSLNRTVSENITKLVHQFLLNNDVEKEYINQIKGHEINFIFPKILSYKKQLNNLLNFNSGWLECHPRLNMLFFHLLLVDDINQNLQGKYEKLDEIIELIINPANKAFSEKELIENFGYISDDQLDEIEMD